MLSTLQVCKQQAVSLSRVHLSSVSVCPSVCQTQVVGRDHLGLGCEVKMGMQEPPFPFLCAILPCIS